MPDTEKAHVYCGSKNLRCIARSTEDAPGMYVCQVCGAEWRVTRKAGSAHAHRVQRDK